MPVTYENIATTTLGSTQTTVTFSSIPGTYTDLVLVISGTVSTNQNYALRFNGDTGSNYSDTNLFGDGSSALSNRRSNQTVAYIGVSGTNPSPTISNIMNYANTTTNKTIISRSGYATGTAAQVESRVALWRSTAAITSIEVSQSSMLSGTTLTLYGIKAA